MSVETKIKALLESSARGDKTQPMQGDSKKAEFDNDDEYNTSLNTSKDTSKSSKVAIAGDKTQPMQGDSKKAEFDELDDGEPGKEAAKSLSKDTSKAGKASINGDATQPMQGDSKKATWSEDVTLTQEQIQAIFGSDLTEEHQQKAVEIFEAAVISRVNAEIMTLEEKYESYIQESIDEHKDVLVEKINSYLDYIVEKWMEDNAIAIDQGIKVEVHEEFMSGLKSLFESHYIDIPEDKVDVLGEMQEKIQSMETRLNEEINKNVEMSSLITEAKRLATLEKASEGLVDTDAERFAKLAEGIEYDDSYSDKLKVVRATHFGKHSSEETTLNEDTGAAIELNNSRMSIYSKALSKSIKK